MYLRHLGSVAIRMLQIRLHTETRDQDWNILSAGRDVQVLDAALGLRPRTIFSSPRSQFFFKGTALEPEYNVFIFSLPLSDHFCNCLPFPYTNRACVVVTVIRDWKIRIALRTNQITRPLRKNKTLSFELYHLERKLVVCVILSRKKV